MFGYTKNGFFLNPLSKNSTFYFYRLIGFSYLRHVAKFVFFFVFVVYLDYFVFVSSFDFSFSFGFLSSFAFFFTFYLMIHKS